MRKTVEVRGARENNLKNIDVEIPRETLTVITGVSGSGKSSLAYDVIYGEGQRRLLDSLSVFAKRFIPQPKRADVDFVFGLSPVVAIMQKKGMNNPRSTVGTMTDIYDYLRLLFCVVGTAECVYCRSALSIKTVDQVIERIQTLPEGTVVEIRAPVVKVYGEDYAYLFNELRQQGHRTLIIDGQRYDSGDKIDLDEHRGYAIEVVLDKVIVKADIRNQTQTTLEHGMRIGEGFLRFELSNQEMAPERFAESCAAFYDGFACPEHHVAMRELEPYYFSFNDPDSACRTCGGLGMYLKADPRLIVAKPQKSIRQGALTNTFLSVKHPYKYMLLYSLAQRYDFSLDVPFEDLSERAKDVILNGTRGERFELVEPPDATKRAPQVGQHIVYEGIVNQLDRRFKQLREQGVPVSSDSYFSKQVMTERACPDCGGTRLKPQRLCVTVGGKTIHELGRMPLTDLKAFLETITVPADKRTVGDAVVQELVTRVTLLVDIGVGYLNLSRNASTISGGEAQRVRLSTQIGSGLMGMMYILDEPSIGLHPRDGYRIIDTMKKLRDIGNTVIVVEHDVETMRAADHVIEMGPGPGVHGGQVVTQGTVEEMMRSPTSITGQYLSGKRRIALPAARRSPNGHALRIVGARQHNLKNLTVEIPLGVFVCVSGVSGSGKSSLVHDVLYKTLHARFHDRRTIPGEADRVEGVEHIDSVISIDQSYIGRTSTSNPATYIGIFDRIRKMFAATPAAQALGYTHAAFSFNGNLGGRCEECRGRGTIVTPLQFMPDVESVCPVCKGKRYRKDVLEVTYRGKNIAEVLDMSFEEAAGFFQANGEAHARDRAYIARKIGLLDQLGLGYLKLGQSSSTLSGGEIQRVKLATELSKVKRGHKLYILDEPTTGLHLADIQRLLDCLNRLVDAGHTVLVIEHHLEVIKSADYVIDLGPDGGNEGGCVVAQGTPEEVVGVGRSHTGRYLRACLDGSL
ncbi:MAG: excinuclease ABC subunit UvrA [Chloroflexi bacterium]|nr:excinuclease ABC subunit UvrA [Chloroflexota bacterium]